MAGQAEKCPSGAVTPRGVDTRRAFPMSDRYYSKRFLSLEIPGTGEWPKFPSYLIAGILDNSVYVAVEPTLRELGVGQPKLQLSRMSSPLIPVRTATVSIDGGVKKQCTMALASQFVRWLVFRLPQLELVNGDSRRKVALLKKSVVSILLQRFDHHAQWTRRTFYEMLLSEAPRVPGIEWKALGDPNDPPNVQSRIQHGPSGRRMYPAYIAGDPDWREARADDVITPIGDLWAEYRRR